MADKKDEIRAALSDLENSNPSEGVRTSITFQAEAGAAEWLERFAFAAGQKRTHPTTKRVEGNTSWAVNEAIGFLRSHLGEYMAERAARLAQALGEPGPGGE